MTQPFDQDTPSYSTPGVETPYLRAKQAWDERLSSVALSADHWRKIAIISSLISLLLLISFVLSLSWHKPSLYVAEVSQGGQIMNVKLLSQSYEPTQAQEEYFLTQFIKLISNVPLDPVAAKNNWLAAYSFLSDRGAKELNDYFQKNNPLSALNKKTVTTTITDVNPLSKNSYEIDWTEQSIDQNGQILGEKNMSGVFTIVVQTPKTKEAMLQNPLGIYIVDFHISPKVGP